MAITASPAAKPVPVAKTVPVTPPAPEAPARLVSLDAYRGFVMLLMVSAALYIPRVVRDHHLDSRTWQFFGYELDHVEWTGCSLWDLIQPSFMFMVGVALPYSYASRRRKGDSKTRIGLHVVFRSIILILLGIFLVSKSADKNGVTQADITFVNVLTQIGLGYCFAYFFVGKPLWIQLLGLAVILGGYWAVFAFSPLPSPGFNYKQYHASEHARFPDPRGDQIVRKAGGRGSPAADKEGEAAKPAKEHPPQNEHIGAPMHWNKNANFAADVDHEFLKLFPSPKPIHDRLEGGYTTLNFIPSIGTMLLGVMAGEWLRRKYSHGTKFLVLVGAGILCLGIGLAIDHYVWPDWLLQMTGAQRDWSLCPVVKRIWTPSWVIFSAGWTFLMLAGFYLVIDIFGLRVWAFPLVVVGMNSIAMYCMAQLIKPWIAEMFRVYLGRNVFEDVANTLGTYPAIVIATTQLLVLWLFCLWLYRQRIFIKI